MSPEEWRDIYNRAWDTFYSLDHVETIMRRAAVSGMNPRRIMRAMIWFYACHAYERVHPLQGGRLRRKYRLDRRPGFGIESPLVFYPKLLLEFVTKHAKILLLYRRYVQALKRVENDPAKDSYSDLSLSPVVEEDLDELDIFTATEFGQAAVEKMRKQRKPAEHQIAAAQ